MRQKNIILVLIFIVMGIGFSYGLQSHQPKPQNTNSDTTLPKGTIDLKRAQIPNVNLETLSGDTLNLEDYRGKTVLLNFWATWCPPCLIEFPDLLKIAQQHPKDIVIIFVSSDQNKSDINTFIEKLPKAMQSILRQDNIVMVHDKGGRVTRDVFQTYKLPESYLVNKNTFMTHKFIGALSPKHKDFIQGYIKKIKD